LFVVFDLASLHSHLERVGGSIGAHGGLVDPEFVDLKLAVGMHIEAVVDVAERVGGILASEAE
jgi:hypothetical protein